jgi:hypothetical protein
MTRGRIAEPIAIHVMGKSGLPLEFSWRGRRHQIREVLGLVTDGRYQLRTASGLRCLISQQPGHWQLDRLI